MFWPGGEWRKIEGDVSSTVTSNLKENGIEWATVDTKNRGRDVLLSGSAPSEEAKSKAIRVAETLAQDKRGNPVARVVEWEGNVAKSVVVEPVVELKPEIVEPVVELEPGNLSFNAVEGKIILNGNVANESQKQDLFDAAVQTYGVDNVIDRLSVEDNILPINNIGSLVSGFGLSDGTLRVSVEKGLKITGEVESEDRKQSIGQGLQATLGAGYSINNLLSIAEPVVVEDTSAICQAKVESLMSESKIFFATSKADIKPESYALLDNIANILAECKESSVQVSGHTDSSGSQAINQPLSLNRAKAVIDYLIAKGVDENRLTSAGFGADNPIADNTTNEGRAANRRIEFTVK